MLIIFQIEICQLDFSSKNRMLRLTTVIQIQNMQSQALTWYANPTQNLDFSLFSSLSLFFLELGLDG